jgi:hypothetical protein
MPNAKGKEEMTMVEDGENSEEAEFQDAVLYQLSTYLFILYAVLLQQQVLLH